MRRGCGLPRLCPHTHNVLDTTSGKFDSVLRCLPSLCFLGKYLIIRTEVYRIRCKASSDRRSYTALCTSGSLCPGCPPTAHFAAGRSPVLTSSWKLLGSAGWGQLLSPWSPPLWQGPARHSPSRLPYSQPPMQSSGASMTGSSQGNVGK